MLIVGLHVHLVVSYDNITTQLTNTTTPTVQCRITASDQNVVQSFQKLLKDQAARLVRIHVILDKLAIGILNGLEQTSTFLPLRWVKLKDVDTQRMLFLKKDMLLLPFSVLSSGIIDFNVHITESRFNCFMDSGMNITHFQEQLRVLILNDFQSSTKSLSDQRVCNQHLRDKDGTADFFYVCCYYDTYTEMVCEELKQDIWTKLFFKALLVVDIILILYCPLFVPEVLYREKYVKLVFRVQLKEHIALKILKASEANMNSSRSNALITIRNLRKVQDMTELTKIISDFPDNSIRVIPITTLLLKIKKYRLVPRNAIPVGLLETLYRWFVLCDIRNRNSVKDCCYGNLFGTVVQSKILWYKCLQKLMNVLILLLLSLPWLLRVYLFYSYEDQIEKEKSIAARKRHLELQYPGSILAYLTPVHVVFLILYCIVILDVILFGVLPAKFKEHAMYIIRKSFRDMVSINRKRALGYCIHILLIPVKKFGVFFLAIAWLYWLIALPELVLFLAYYFMPLVNLVCKLTFSYVNLIFPVIKCFSPIILAYRNFYKTISSENKILDFLIERDLEEPKEPKTKKDKMITVLSSIILITMVISFTVLALEFIFYFIEFICYQLIGLILYWESLLKYVTLIFIVILYSRDCLNSVGKKYNVFYDKLLAVMKSRVSDELIAIVSKNETEQENQGIQVICDETPHNATLNMVGSSLKWRIPQLVLFVDKTDVYYLTRHFFFACSEIKKAGFPGNLMANYCKAFSQLLKILLFLLFVILVIAAFGKRYEVSGVNQTFLAAAGGILPWVFKNILFKSPPEFEIDTESPSFQNSIDKKLQTYVEHANVFDILSEGEITESDDFTNIDLGIIDEKKTENDGSIVLSVI